MTLKLNPDLDTLKAYHHTKNEVARLNRLKGRDSLGWKNTKIAPKVKGHDQISPTSNNFWSSTWIIFLVVLQTDIHWQKPARSMQAIIKLMRLRNC